MAQRDDVARMLIAIEAQNKQLVSTLNDTQRRLQSFGRKANKQAQQFDQNWSKAGRSFSKDGSRSLRFGIQNLSYQLQDVAVQAEAGTNSLRIFAQQGPQIFSVFGPLGAIAGVFAAIGAAAVSAFMQMDESAEEAEKQIKGLADRLPSLESGVKSLKELAEQYAGAITSTGDAQDGATTKIIANLQREFAARQTLARLALIKAKAEQEGRQKALSDLRSKMRGEGIFPSVQHSDEEIDARVRRSGLKGSEADALRERLRNRPMVSEERLQEAIEMRLNLSEQVAQLIAESELAQIEIDANEAALSQSMEGLAATIDSGGRSGGGSAGGATRSAMRSPLPRFRNDSFNRNQEAQKRLRQAVSQTNSEVSRQQQLWGEIGSAMETAIMRANSFKDALRILAAQVLPRIVSQMQNAKFGGGGGSGGFLGDLLGFAGSFIGAGDFGGGGKVSVAGKRAVGGRVAMGSPYLVGEAGPEPFVPDMPGRILSHNDAMRAASGGGSGGGVTVNQTINVSTGVSQTVRHEIMTLMPQISESAKMAVLEARKRGGAYAGAFR